MATKNGPIKGSSEIDALAKELRLLAETGQFEALAKKFPPMEILADMLEFLMKYPGMAKKFEQQVLKGAK
jgi:hypothetical protein